MQKKLSLTFIITLILFLLTLPLLLAQSPTLTPPADNLTDLRPLYRAVFGESSHGGRVHWLQSETSYSGTTYAPGSFYAPDGSIAGDSISGTVDTRPAYALNTAGKRIAIFRSTFSGDFGNAAWELADVREVLDGYLLGAVDYDILDETALESANLSQYDLLIFPTVYRTKEAEVVDELSQTALDQVQTFVEQGGFVYAQGNGAFIVEKTGLLLPGTVDLDSPLQTVSGNNLGQMTVLNSASPLSFGWLTNTLYLLQDPSLNPNGMDVVAEFSNLDGPNQPAILTKEEGQGRVILVAGHPTFISQREQLPLFFNAILWATGHRAELYGQAKQIYNPNLQANLIPAYEPGTPVQVDLSFANLWDEPLYNVTITETIAAGFVITGAMATPPSAISQNALSQTVLVWEFSVVPPGEVPLDFFIETGLEQLDRGELPVVFGEASYAFDVACPEGGTGCLPWNGTLPLPGSSILPDISKFDSISHQPFILESRMAARLLLDRDIEADRHFHIPEEGIFLTADVPIENKEDSLASSVVLTDVVLLVSPIVDLEDQETILDQNNGQTVWIENEVFFYTESGSPYLPADGYVQTDTINLADWTGEYAVFDVPYGTHNCNRPNASTTRGLGNCITIPLSYTNIITLTPDGKLLLPVKTLRWSLGDWPGYHYEEPALRYGIRSHELFSRTVTFDGNPGIVPDDVVIQGSGGSIYTHLGTDPLVYREHVAHTTVYVPHTPVTPTISYLDIWSRTHTQTLRAAFYDVFSWASCACGLTGTGESHAALNVTYGMEADVDGSGTRDDLILLYPSRLDGADVDIVIKSRALIRNIPAEEMVIDMGMFKGLGVNIRPQNTDWFDSFSSNGTNLITVENLSAYDRLYFQHDINLDGTAVITIHAKIDSYSDKVTEGMLKLHDGARLAYRQQFAGPNRYEVYDTRVQGLIGAAPEILIEKLGVPVQLNTYGDQVYFIFTLDDPADPRVLHRNGKGDPFLQSYGFGLSAATTYLGGKDGYNILHSLVSPGDKTRLRVEINNNTDTTWQNIIISPEPPTGLSITPVYTNNVPPPIYPDLPFLHVKEVPSVGRGVYYYDVQVSENYSGATGVVITIPIAIQADGLPLEFTIPSAQLGIANQAEVAYRSFGIAQSLALTDSLPTNVSLSGAVLISQAELEAMTNITKTERHTLFDSFTNTISYTVDMSQTVTFDLGAERATQLYNPADDKLRLAVRATVTPTQAGPMIVNYGAQVTYTDEQGSVWTDTSNSVLAEVHGALLKASYDCVESGLIGTTISEDCLLYPNQDNQVMIDVTVYNAGDYPATNVTNTLILPAGVTVIEADGGEVISQTITWRNLPDLAPGSAVYHQIQLLVNPNITGNLNRQLIPLFIELINRSDGQFVDTFTEEVVEAQTGGAFYLPLEGGQRQQVYLPLLIKKWSPAFEPIFISQTILPQPIAITGATFYSVTLNLPISLPANGYFYFSTQPDSVTETLVDDQIAIVLNGVDVFTFTYSIVGEQPYYRIVEVPRTVMNSIAGQTVEIQFRDVYGSLVHATEMYLIHVEEQVE